MWLCLGLRLTPFVSVATEAKVSKVDFIFITLECLFAFIKIIKTSLSSFKFVFKPNSKYNELKRRRTKITNFS